MEPFPGVAMEIQQVHPLLHGLRDSLHADTDRDRLILGSFSCKRVKVIAIILSCKESSPLGAGNSDQGPGAAVLGSVPPGRSGSGGCCASGGSSRGCFPCSEMCPCSSSILCHSRTVLHGCWGAPPVSPTTSRQDLSSTRDSAAASLGCNPWGDPKHPDPKQGSDPAHLLSSFSLLAAAVGPPKAGAAPPAVADPALTRRLAGHRGALWRFFPL